MVQFFWIPFLSSTHLSFSCKSWHCPPNKDQQQQWARNSWKSNFFTKDNNQSCNKINIQSALWFVDGGDHVAVKKATTNHQSTSNRSVIFARRKHTKVLWSTMEWKCLLLRNITNIGQCLLHYNGSIVVLWMWTKFDARTSVSTFLWDEILPAVTVMVLKFVV